MRDKRKSRTQPIGLRNIHKTHGFKRAHPDKIIIRRLEAELRDCKKAQRELLISFQKDLDSKGLLVFGFDLNSVDGFLD